MEDGTAAEPSDLTVTPAPRIRFPGHEQVLFVRARSAALRAIIAIHSTALGPAFGGCRIQPYGSARDALLDALRLSRAMSYKAAFAGVPFGGGKCVVLADPRSCKTEALLLALGNAIQRMGGRYLTADDVGTTVRDMDVLRRVTCYARGLPDANGDPCPATAYGVFMAITAAARFRWGMTDLKGLSVAVQGLGCVGFALCRYLHEAGALLRVSDLRPDLLARARDAFAATPVPVDRILFEDVDVLSPNALGDVFTVETVPEIRAAVIAGAANNQLQSAELGVALHRRGILYVPDYVANAGGLIDVAKEGPGYSQDSVLRACESIYARTLRLLETAERSRTAVSVIADRDAEALLGISHGSEVLDVRTTALRGVA
jgi:leucine dehydrogenase